MKYLSKGSAKYLQSQKVPNVCTTFPGQCKAWYTSSKAVQSIYNIRNYLISLPGFQGVAT